MTKTKRASPRWGFKNIIDAGPYPITSKDIRSVGQKLGITFTDDLINQSIEVCRRYLSDKKVLDKWPRPSEQKPALRKVHDRSKEFLKVLEQLDPASRASLNSRAGVDIESTRSGTEMICHAAQAVLEDISDKGGPSPRLALKVFVRELKGIYEQATGKQAGMPYTKSKRAVVYDPETGQDIDAVTGEVLDNETAQQMPEEIKAPEGPFFRFVYCVLEIIDPSTTKSTLFSAIKSALKITS